MMNIRRGWLGMAALTCAATASASNYTGQIVTIRTSASATGDTRISVQVAGVTSCPFAGWYSFEFASNGPGKSWFAQLLEAKASDRSLLIAGTGACDTSGLEKIAYIDTP